MQGLPDMDTLVRRYDLGFQPREGRSIPPSAAAAAAAAAAVAAAAGPTPHPRRRAIAASVATCRTPHARPPRGLDYCSARAVCCFFMFLSNAR